MPPKKRPIEDRFWEKVAPPDANGCRVWLAARYHNGYGTLKDRQGKRMVNWLAHRLAYQLTFGPIPEGLEIDHLCRNRACVEPSHLEAVTSSTNKLRGLNPAIQRLRHASKLQCKNGHPFSPENTYIPPHQKMRQCRACKAASSKRRMATPEGRRAAVAASARWRARQRAGTNPHLQAG